MAMRQQVVELRLAVPLPPLTAAVFVDSSDSRPRIPSKPADPGARVAHEFVRKEQRDGPDGREGDVVVVRSLGGGRKRKLAAAADRDGDCGQDEQEGGGEGGEAEGAAAGSDDPDSDGGVPVSPTGLQSQSQRTDAQMEDKPGNNKAKKKKKKRKDKRERKDGKERKERKEQQEAAEGTGDGPEDGDPSRRAGDDADADGAGEDAAAQPQPFDYAAAPSVLNPVQEPQAADGKTKKKQKKTAFDPYAQSASAPRGLARANQERAGRAGTFKG